MKGERRHQTSRQIAQHDIRWTEFARWGKNALIEMQFGAVRNAETGETRFHVTIPSAENIAFGHDMGVLLQTFGWGMAKVVFDLEAAYGTAPVTVWEHCCQTITLVEYHLRLDDQD